MTTKQIWRLIFYLLTSSHKNVQIILNKLLTEPNCGEHTKQAPTNSLLKISSILSNLSILACQMLKERLLYDVDQIFES